MKKNHLFSKKYQFHYIWGTTNFNQIFYVMGAKNRLAGNCPKMLLWAWIFQNGVNFWFILLHCPKLSHICGFNTHMLKFFSFLTKFKFLKTIPVLVSVGIIYPKIIILGHKMGFTPQKSIFWYFFWKSVKKLKMAISQPLMVLDQNPLGGKVYLGQGSKPCPNCMDTSQLKFLHLATLEKNGHLIN